MIAVSSSDTARDAIWVPLTRLGQDHTTIKNDLHDALDDDGGLYEARTEVNVLEGPASDRCQWNKGCAEPGTHNVCQYNPYSLEDTIDGVDLRWLLASKRWNTDDSARIMTSQFTTPELQDLVAALAVYWGWSVTEIHVCGIRAVDNREGC